MILLNEQAYFHLQEMIMSNQLSYHKIYSETKLASELGISRTPFRDAIHRLASEGYIDIIPSKGFRLHELTRRDVHETFQIRSALECYCTLQITKAHKSPKAAALFEELGFTVSQLKKVLETTQSITDFCEYDFMFHTKIIDYIENEQFTSIFANFMYRMRRLAESSLAHEGRMNDTYYEHLAIYEAMKKGDIENIYNITLKHMENPAEINLSDL
ncbi:MAG: GntR family transcriptional regulator [Lachnospiraceae bacterium]